ncbi:hypothetical protein M433DRAFT_133285 [Acidomyces richmondensis BFW]|nr:MAG: hypothetical protein FE78DRAFT_77888 [Acidomyces sp. 'richmondensis']KYG47068.1 hypothetical protein M433DRAFT_133285 [Acidomyces richmondensis BFW]
MPPQRTLGGGRVLGSGKSLAPPPPPTTTTVAPAVLSPSASSLSLSSHTTSSTPLSVNDDLTARVDRHHHHHPGNPDTVAGAGISRMVCPICDEEMVTLLQLNRHIDDNHSNLEEVEQDEAKTWFKQQMVKARKFQPFQLLNQKLRGLEVFESNNNNNPDIGPVPLPPPTTQPGTVSHPSSRTASPRRPAPLDPEDIITKSHWQRPLPPPNDICSDPLCPKPRPAPIHCRHCGKLFCEPHTMYQMKLSRTARADPVRGLWYRVCETCYKSRPGYNDHTGSERSHMEFFATVRGRVVERAALERGRLEGRLTRLTRLLVAPAPSSSVGGLWASLAGSGRKAYVRTLEQSIVPWEEDEKVSECPECRRAFSASLRRHHCRTCGRVVCGDPATECSRKVALDVEASENAQIPTSDIPPSEKFPHPLNSSNITDARTRKKIPLDIRLCKSCTHLLFPPPPPPPSSLDRAHNHLMQFEIGIRLLLPKFQRLLASLQDSPTHEQVQEAGKVRKRLMEAFTRYEKTAKDIAADGVKVESSAEARVREAIGRRAAGFLGREMLTLKAVPKMMGRPTLKEEKRKTTEPISFSSGNERAAALEADEKRLRERLAVLEEQSFLVGEMVEEARRGRRLDEVAALVKNREEVEREAAVVKRELESLDFEGVYVGGKVG